ncbi:MAG: ATP-binding protein [Solitalea sp.]
MIKNPTPRMLALFTALLVALVVGILGLIYGLSFLHNLLAIVLVTALAYMLIYYSLEYFIYRKIKLIYKSIHQLKTQRTDPSSVPYFGDSSHDPIAAVATDVQAWAEARKGEIETLKKTEEYRKEFLGNVAHELKTPIFNIQGYVNTLLDGAMDDPEVLRHFLQKAAKSADRIADMVNDLEAISNLESGRESMELEFFDINALIKDVFDSLEYMASQKKIILDFKEGCNYTMIVEGDKYRIRQVLANLVTNSIKYGRPNGKVLAGMYDMDENMLIEITDNGIGIAPEHLPRLFERFYRVDKSRSRAEGGTGLGLSIVKHIIESHDQTINVRSTPGIGTTFGFTLKKG